MLDVLHTIDMAVDVDVVVIGVDGAHQLGVVTHLHSPTLVDGTRLVLDNPVVDGSVIDAEDVGRLASLCVYHGPDAAAVAVDFCRGRRNEERGGIVPFGLGSHHGEVAAGEVAHSTLNPRLDIELGVLRGHLGHLDGKT